MAAYPSGFQPYRNSHFQYDEWEAAGYDRAFIEDYLGSNVDSYNHPNAAIEPRIPGIFQYYSIAEDELVKGIVWPVRLGAGDRRRNRGRLGEDHRPDRAREPDQALQGLARHVATTGGARPRAPLSCANCPAPDAQNACKRTRHTAAHDYEPG